MKAQNQFLSAETMQTDNFKTLVVVDVQRDFFDPGGALYVEGSETLPAKIAALAGNYDAIVFTLDWHPGNHCSFKPQGGPWPPHCVAFTQGAGLADEFTPILAKNPEQVQLFLKGQEADKEQYGAFEDPEIMDETLLDWFSRSKQIDVCGIAGDYCVKESTKNLLKLVPASKVCLLGACIRSIDDGSTLKAFAEEHHLVIK
ncbi:MAG: isochorismatase family protein [Candidatus Cryptobacteroides sp.]|jgi:nicotinamidase/pyrazinamidase